MRALAFDGMLPRFSLSSRKVLLTILFLSCWQLSDFHGNDLQDVDKAYDNVVVSVRVVVGSQILEHQLTGKTSRVIEMGSAVFSGLAAPSCALCTPAGTEAAGRGTAAEAGRKITPATAAATA